LSGRAGKDPPGLVATASCSADALSLAWPADDPDVINRLPICSEVLLASSGILGKRGRNSFDDFADLQRSPTWHTVHPPSWSMTYFKNDLQRRG
jgi:hypothetical protein